MNATLSFLKKRLAFMKATILHSLTSKVKSKIREDEKVNCL